MDAPLYPLQFEPLYETQDWAGSQLPAYLGQDSTRAAPPPGTASSWELVDAGERWVLSDVGDKAMRAWDGRGQAFWHLYDRLQRPTHVFVSVDHSASWGLVQRAVYGEELADVRSRVVAGLDEVVARHKGQVIALVSHTVVNRVLLCAVLGWGNDRFWRLQQETCAVNVFDVEEDGDFTIVLINDSCHLQGLSV